MAQVNCILWWVTMDHQHLITIEPGKRGGKPCIRGMRITVSDVLEYLAAGMSVKKSSRTSPNSQPMTSGLAWPSLQIASAS